MPMQGRTWSLFLVFLFMVPLLPLYHTPSEEIRVEDEFWTSEQASEYWTLGASPTLEKSTLRLTSGLLHPVTGSFDPLVLSPSLPGILHDDLDVVRQNYLLKQLMLYVYFEY